MMTTTTDQLTRAWNLLREGERPEGLCLMPDGEWVSYGDRGFRDVSDAAAYDRLVVAVEGALFESGWDIARYPGELWEWTKGGYSGKCPIATDTDRLTAACDAVEAERGSDA